MGDTTRKKRVKFQGIEVEPQEVAMYRRSWERFVHLLSEELDVDKDSSEKGRRRLGRGVMKAAQMLKSASPEVTLGRG